MENKQSIDLNKFAFFVILFNKKNVEKHTNKNKYNKFKVKLFKLKWLNQTKSFLPLSVYTLI